MRTTLRSLFCVLFPLLLVGLCFLLVPGRNHGKKRPVDEGREKVTSENGNSFSIVIQPLGDFPAEKSIFLREAIEEFYNCSSVTINKNVELPASAWYAPRQRYIADSLLAYLQRIKPGYVTLIIGVTTNDIATEKGSNPNYGVMGLGYCPGNACVVSTFRLTKKIPSGFSSNKRKSVFMDRLCKVCLHELGHNLGLPHCEANDSCLMNDADGTIAQVDRERKFLCARCSENLRIKSW